MKQQAILYLDRNYFDYYDQHIPNTIRYLFNASIIQDLEVVDTNQLNTEIKTFVETNKLLSASLLIILSQNVLFEKDLIDIPPEKMLQEEQNFLNTIPFENLNYQKYKMEKGEKLIATNKDLYDRIKSAFELIGFSVETVKPISMLGIAIQLPNGMDVASAQHIMSKVSSMRKDNLLDTQIEPTPETNAPTYTKKQKMPSGLKNKILIASAVVLFGSAGVLVFLSFQNPTTTPKVQSTTVQPTIVQSAPIPTQTPQIEEPTPLPTIIPSSSPSAVASPSAIIR